MTDPEQLANKVNRGLELAWNAADANAYAACFTMDADLINVFGMHFHGRDAIAGLMSRVFATIFRDSSTRHVIESAVFLTPDVILLRLSGTLNIVAGPQPREVHNRQTMVLMLEDGIWRIRSFQNTGVNESAPAVARPTRGP